MKLHEQKKKKKVDYFDAVVLIKSGKFYVTFDYDAEIIHKLLNYKIVHHRIGFPENALDQVIACLKENHISYVKDEETFLELDNNQYISILKQVQNEQLVESMCNNLLNKIKNAVVVDFNNYDKIRKFLNEL